MKFWQTLNEPWVVAINGHEDGQYAPGIVGKGTHCYTAAHNMIRAHAKAYRVYQKEFRPTQKGKVGISLNVNWAEPRDPENEDDLAASDRRHDFFFSWFAKPILNDGKYPKVMREKIDAKSKAEGLEKSRLPEFSASDSKEIAKSFDFLAVNHYTASIVFTSVNNEPGYWQDQDIGGFSDPKWYKSGSSWLYVAPFGFRRILNWIHKTYPEVDEIYITENGFSDNVGNIDDLQRTYYFKHYINQMLKAVKLDNVPVKGYFAWSLMDNFEWSKGYEEKFGIHYVNFSDPERPRKQKTSAKFLAKLAADNGFRKQDVCLL